jgi:putative FmdB family regulatory protein
VPTYQYTCTSCGRGLEAFQSFTDDALTDCPECGGRLRKVFNSVGIVFKGSGFYRTDSREKTPAAASAGKSDGAKESGDSSGSTSESKKSDSAASTGSTPAAAKKSDSAPATGGSSSTSSSTAGSAA